METVNASVHEFVHEFLTRNILIKQPDGTYDTNKHGDIWQLVWQVVFLKGTKILASKSYEGPQLTLSEYQDGTKLSMICSELRAQVDAELLNLNAYAAQR